MDFTAKNMDSQFEEHRPILSFVGNLTRLAAVLINCPGESILNEIKGGGHDVLLNLKKLDIHIRILLNSVHDYFARSHGNF